MYNIRKLISTKSHLKIVKILFGTFTCEFEIKLNEIIVPYFYDKSLNLRFEKKSFEINII